LLIVATKHELQQEIERLRNRLKENEELLRLAAIRLAHLDGLKAGSVAALGLREDAARQAGDSA
jgi:hypothetical protein